MLCVFVCILALVIRQEKGIFSIQHHIIMCGLSDCTTFFPTLTHKCHDFRGGNMCFDLPYKFLSETELIL
jgi:hypothetical protein